MPRANRTLCRAIGRTWPPRRQQAANLQATFHQTSRTHDYLTDLDIGSLEKRLGFALLSDPPRGATQQYGGYDWGKTLRIGEVSRFIKDINKRVRFQSFPARITGNQIRTTLDTASSSIGPVSCLICVASMCAVPISPPLLAVAEVASVVCCVVNTYLGVETLLGRRRQGDATSLADPKVREIYFKIAAGVTGTVSSLGLLRLHEMARSGESLTLGAKRVVEGVTILAVGVSGGRVVNHLVNVIEKRRNGEAVAGEAVGVVASAFCFCNTVLTTERVCTLVDEMQNNNSLASRMQNVIRIKLQALRYLMF